MESDVQEWFDQNYNIGLMLGYPRCCVSQFCKDSPLTIAARRKKSSTCINDMTLRYNSAFINGQYTGFIPCTFHALEITKGNIKLEDLIQNRDSGFPPFPLLY